MAGAAKSGDAQDIGAVLEEIYGPVDWQAAGGVVHVTAIAAADRTTIALGPAAPSSEMDRFVLGFARARAEALVTTGSILRAEPDLVHRYAEEASRDAEWKAWREAALGRGAAPGLMLLSRTGDFPLGHPAIEAAESGFVWTSSATRSRLGARIGELEVVAAEQFEAGRTGLSGALAFARTRHGLTDIAIEAGPSATRELYEPGAATVRPPVDELMLSLYEGELAKPARAAEFASEVQVRAARLQRLSRHREEEPSGVWFFERHRAQLA